MIAEAPAHNVDFAKFEIDPAFRPQWTADGVTALRSHSTVPAARAYSLANPPQEGDRAILVVRLALPPGSAPEGTPPGVVSSYLFSLRSGDKLSIRGPYGDFHAHDSGAEMVLIGGGAGIAPLRSITLDVLARSPSRPMSFWYGARNESEIAYALELAALAEHEPAFEFHVALSGPGVGPDWTGLRGFVHQVAYTNFLRDHPDLRALEFYICGPPLMSAAVLQMLDGLGVSRERVFLDDFGT